MVFTITSIEARVLDPADLTFLYFLMSFFQLSGAHFLIMYGNFGLRLSLKLRTR